MRPDIFRFWRYIPRFSLGLLFSLELLLIILQAGGNDAFKGQTLLEEFRENLGTVGATLFTLIATGILASIGAMLLDVLIELCYFAFTPFRNITARCQSNRLCWKEVLMLHPNDVAFKMFNKHSNELITTFKYRALASLENVDNQDDVKNWMKIVKRFIRSSTASPWVQAGLARFNRITQDRVFGEHLWWDVSNIYGIWALAAVSVYVIELYEIVDVPVLGSVLVGIGLFISTLPGLIERKKTYALFIIHSILDSYQMAGEGEEQQPEPA